jgi:cytochrome c oxidase assembly protein subunit 15
MLEPFWLNFFNNMATVQFDHRLLAWVLLFLAPCLWWQVRRSGVPNRARRGADLLLGLVVLQFGLGVATLLAVVPVGLAAAHQGVATLVFAAALFTAHALRPAR